MGNIYRFHGGSGQILGPGNVEIGFLIWEKITLMHDDPLRLLQQNRQIHWQLAS